MSGRPIRIAVVFEPGKPARPVWFELDRRKHVISRTTYRWHNQVGGRSLFHYAVSDGDALYELVYDPVDHSWRLYQQVSE